MPVEPGQSRADADRSFEQLYEGHREEVYWAALRALGNADDAEDVTQAAFVDAYRAILRGSRPRAPRAWLLAIAENVRRRRFRSALRRPREEPLDVESAAATELVPEHAEAVRRALATLPPQQREVFLLRELSGLSYGEIAERTGSTTASVQMLLFRARRELRAELDPPAVTQRRRSLGVQLPAWLAQLAGRGDTLVLAPRGAGAVGAAVLAVSGVTAGALHVQQHGAPRSEPTVLEQPRLLPTTRLTAARSRAPQPAAPQRVRKVAPTKTPRAAPARPAPAPSPAPTPAATPAPTPAAAATPPAPQPVAPPPALTRESPTPVQVSPPELVVPLPASTPAVGVVPPVALPVPPVVVPVPPVVIPVPPVVVPVSPVEPPELPKLIEPIVPLG